MFDVNVQGTLNVVRAAAEAGVRRVVYASTSGIVAVSRDGAAPPPSDASPYAREVTAGWPYYVSKLQAEEEARSLARQLGVDLVCMRPTLLLGPGDWRLSSCRSVYDLLHRRVPFLPGGGLTFVDVRDAAGAFAAAMQAADLPPDSTFLLGSGSNLTMQRYFAMVEAASSVPAPWLPMPGAAAVLGARLISLGLGLLGKYDPTFDPVYVQVSETAALAYCQRRWAGVLLCGAKA